MSCSPRRRIRLVTVIGGLAACLHPVGPTCLRRLDTSNGCQDHTILPSASAPFVSVLFDRSQACQPALPSRHTPDAAASTASRPASVTIAIRPSVGRDSGDIGVIWVRREGEYFCKRDWTASIRLIRLNKSLRARMDVSKRKQDHQDGYAPLQGRQGRAAYSAAS